MHTQLLWRNSHTHTYTHTHISTHTQADTHTHTHYTLHAQTAPIDAKIVLTQINTMYPWIQMNTLYPSSPTLGANETYYKGKRVLLYMNTNAWIQYKWILCIHQVQRGAPSSLNPKSSTLNPKVQKGTHIQPSSLNPKSSNLNPRGTQLQWASRVLIKPKPCALKSKAWSLKSKEGRTFSDQVEQRVDKA